MDESRYTNRRTVLKTLGAGVVGGAVMSGSASAHGNDFRVPSWFENQIWEMTAKPPGHTPEESHAPIWHIAPGVAGCPQLENFSFVHDGQNVMAKTTPELDNSQGDWDVVSFDQTLSANPFSTIWHIKWVFDGSPSGSSGYLPGDLVNSATIDGSTEFLTSGHRVRTAADQLDIVTTELAFNCPIRPADEEHRSYCD